MLEMFYQVPVDIVKNEKFDPFFAILAIYYID